VESFWSAASINNQFFVVFGIQPIRKKLEKYWFVIGYFEFSEKIHVKWNLFGKRSVSSVPWQ
jgi:hypothetical protein